MNERLQMVVLSLSDHISLLESYGFGDTARLLEIARLDLQIKINGFTVEEMDQFYSELAARAEERADGQVKPLPKTKLQT